MKKIIIIATWVALQILPLYAMTKDDKVRQGIQVPGLQHAITFKTVGEALKVPLEPFHNSMATDYIVGKLCLDFLSRKFEHQAPAAIREFYECVEAPGSYSKVSFESGAVLRINPVNGVLVKSDGSIDPYKRRALRADISDEDKAKMQPSDLLLKFFNHYLPREKQYLIAGEHPQSLPVTQRVTMTHFEGTKS